MANCPKCDYKLKITDWRQKCPNCGANLILFDLQERLMKEADVAEVQQYHFQKKVDRLKFSFVGSKYAIIRIVTSLLPVLGILIPFVKVSTDAPLSKFSGTLGAIQLYMGIDKKTIDIQALLNSITDDSTKAIMLPVAVAAVLLVLSLVFTLLHFVFLTLACSPKGKIRNYIFDALIAASTLGSCISFLCVPENSFFKGSLFIGAFTQLILVAACIVFDVLAFKNAPPVKHKQCYVGGIPIEEYFKMVEDGVPAEKIRAEMYERLNAIQAEKDAKIAADEAKKLLEDAEKAEKEAVAK